MANATVDVAVVGGGPAGATAALNLARLGLQTTLLESSNYEEPRVGETLPPAARPLLVRLGVAERVAGLGSTPSYGNQSAWGGDDVWSNPFVFGPHGNGWHLDRRAFDRCLAEAAVAAGAELRTGTSVISCAWEQAGPWKIELPNAGVLRANALIDASGRSGLIARSVGAKRRITDHLVGIAARYGGPAHDAGYTLVEATADGWWYSAPIPTEQTMVMFMTDADLCRRGRYAVSSVWSQRLSEAPETERRITSYLQLSQPAVCSAVSQRLYRNDYARRWLATGDAALAVDPLSSSGIVRALRSGEAAAYAIAHWLIGRVEAAADYEHWLDEEFNEYQREQRAYYNLETRWPEAPFWERRRGTPTSFRPGDIAMQRFSNRGARTAQQRDPFEASGQAGARE